ncbi:hypothetical protein [Acaryochloris marina]|uniref:hypothetical protein n=1 Tax=Acaryochloris marina TaxID=155978 RepID=UPI0021C46E6D|nr:hypothetical protein [Acaryochloris marina]BDM83923.1 hypothetical protein AM10699_67840 [Acaryochloris marina MBIC10699]
MSASSSISLAWLNLNPLLLHPRNHKLFLIIGLALLFVLYGATHAHADFASDLISDLEPSAAHDQFWEELWRVTFNRTVGDPDAIANRLAFGAIRTIVRWVTLFALVVVLLHYGGGMMQAGPSVMKGAVFSIKSVIPIVVILTLLANEFAGVHAVGLFVNQARNSVKAEAYAQGEFGSTFREAINDAYFAEQFREKIAFRALSCEAISTPIVAIPSLEEPTNPDPPLTDEQRQLYKKIACIKSMTRYITLNKAIIDKRCAENGNACKGTNQVVANTEKKLRIQFDLGFGDTFTGSKAGQPTAEEFFQEIANAASYGAQSTYRFIFRATQWLWNGFINMGFFLTAVAAPITYAISLMPTKRHFLFDLNLFTLMMFTIAEVGYIISLGIVALMLQTPKLVDLGGYAFPLAYGLLAPLISASMFFGGFKAASSFRGGAISIAATAGGIAGGIATSAVIAFGNRRAQHY